VSPRPPSERDFDSWLECELEAIHNRVKLQPVPLPRYRRETASASGPRLLVRAAAVCGLVLALGSAAGIAGRDSARAHAVIQRLGDGADQRFSEAKLAAFSFEDRIGGLIRHSIEAPQNRSTDLTVPAVAGSTATPAPDAPTSPPASAQPAAASPGSASSSARPSAQPVRPDVAAGQRPAVSSAQAQVTTDAVPSALPAAAQKQDGNVTPGSPASAAAQAHQGASPGAPAGGSPAAVATARAQDGNRPSTAGQGPASLPSAASAAQGGGGNASPGGRSPASHGASRS